MPLNESPECEYGGIHDWAPVAISVARTDPFDVSNLEKDSWQMLECVKCKKRKWVRIRSEKRE